MSDDLATKLVFSGDATGAEKATADAAAGVSKLVQQVQAGDRAVAQLDKELRSLSPEKLQQVAATLEQSIGHAKGGEGVDEFRKRLEQVRGIQAEHAAAGSVSTSNAGGQLLGQLGGELTGLAARVPGVAALGGVFTTLATGPVAAVTAAIAGIGGAVSLAEKALDKFADKQDRITRLDAALAQNGLLTDANREKYQKLAAEYGRATGMGGAFVDVLAKLTKFGADDSNIEQYAEAVKNLAGLLGGDVDRAGTIFARTINGNTSMLRRYGIEVDHTKSKQEQLDSIMSQLAQRGGGQLEAQTHTLHGQMRQLAGAVGAIFTGFGNLISRTGVVQEALSLLTGTFRALSSILPKNVEEVEGLTNKLPPLRDETGKLRGVVDELGGGMDEMGQSADGAADELGVVGEAAGKTKTKFEEATEAAKKLREQQDALASAQLQLKLAQIDSAEVDGRISKDTATRQRAEARASEEIAAVGRKVQEQETIMAGARRDEGEVHARATAAASARNQADAEFNQVAAAAGLTPDEADRLGVEGEKRNKNLFGDKAQARQKDAAAARANVIALQTDTAESGYQDTAEIERQEKVAAVAEVQAIALEKLAKAYGDMRQARVIAENTAKKDTDTQADAIKKLADAHSVLKTLGVEAQVSVSKASTERTKLSLAEEKERLESDNRRIENDLKRKVLPGDQAAQEQGQYDANRRRLNALNFAGDPRRIALENTLLPDAPGAEQNKKYRDARLAQIDELTKTDDEARKELEERRKTAASASKQTAAPLTDRDLSAAGLLTSQDRRRLERVRQDYNEANARDAERGDAPETRGVEDGRRGRENEQRLGAASGSTEPVKTLLAAIEHLRGDERRGGPAQPGTASAAAEATVQRFAQQLQTSGGTTAQGMGEFVRAVDYLTKTLAEKDAPSRDEFQRQARRIEDLAGQIKSGR